MKIAERGSETIFGSSSSAESICLKWSMQPVDDVVWCTYIYTKSTLRMIVKEAISTTKLVEKKSLEQFFIHAAILWIIRNFIWSNYAPNIFSTSSPIPVLAGFGMCYVCAARPATSVRLLSIWFEFEENSIQFMWHVKSEEFTSSHM